MLDLTGFRFHRNDENGLKANLGYAFPSLNSFEGHDLHYFLIDLVREILIILQCGYPIGNE